MSTLKKKEKSTQDGEPFHNILRQTLNHFSNRAKLEENSPLAQPYFLGEAITRVKPGPFGRAAVLQQEIIAAVNVLWNGELPAGKEALIEQVNEERREMGHKGNRYLFLILDLRYLRQFFRPNGSPQANNEHAIIEFLGVGRSPYYRHLKVAREKLAEQLLLRLRPTMRLDQPPKPIQLLNRAFALEKGESALKTGISIAITGPNGSGKTALASTLAQRMGDHPLFWYTFRPEINIYIDTLLFAIGIFLHRLHPSSLWLQLVADEGKVKHLDISLAHLRGDLEALPGLNPIFCFDDLEHLLIDERGNNLKHEALMQLRLIVETFSNSDQCQTVLCGRAVPFSPPMQIELNLFNIDEIGRFLKFHQIEFSQKEIDQLFKYTNGNLRVLNLLPILTSGGKNNLGQTLRAFDDHRLGQGVFDQVWARLSPDEQLSLARLAVYGQAVPSDVLQTEMRERLIHNHFVTADQQGGLNLVPFWQEQIMRDSKKVPIEHKERFHLEAADLFALHGEYSDAARHLIKAGEPERAIQLWFPHRRGERMRGNGRAAEEMFRQISTRRLGKEEQQALTLIRAEFSYLNGPPAEGIKTLEEIKWPPNSRLQIDAHYLKAQFQDALGFSNKSLETYQGLEESLLYVTSKLIHTNRHQSYSYLRARNLAEAKIYGLKAEFEALFLRAEIELAEADFGPAEGTLNQCLAIAQKANYTEGLARVYYLLSESAARQGRYNTAHDNIQTAIDSFIQIGDLSTAKKAQMTLGGILIYLRAYREAVEVYTSCYDFFEKAKTPYWVSIAATGLADAYLELDKPLQAEQYAFKVLQTEEVHTAPYAILILGKLALNRNKFREAEQQFANGFKLALENEDKFMQALYLQARGQAAAAQNDTATAVEKYTRAKEMFEEMGVLPEVEKTAGMLDAIKREEPHSSV